MHSEDSLEQMQPVQLVLCKVFSPTPHPPPLDSTIIPWVTNIKAGAAAAQGPCSLCRFGGAATETSTSSKPADDKLVTLIFSRFLRGIL